MLLESPQAHVTAALLLETHNTHRFQSTSSTCICVRVASILISEKNKNKKKQYVNSEIMKVTRPIAATLALELSLLWNGSDNQGHIKFTVFFFFFGFFFIFLFTANILLHMIS